MRATAVANTDVTECVGKAIGHAMGRGKLSNALSVSMDESEGEGRSYIISDCRALGSSLVLTSWLKMSLVMITEFLLMKKVG